MPRQPRLESQTRCYHVMVRGINKEKIFDTDQEKEKIIQMISEKIKDESCKIAAYCIMNNHLHTIIIAEKSVLISIMKRINISYAMSYNTKHERIGPVFQDRFKSEAITDESYLLGAIRYIHNNPVKAGIVNKVDDYKWSSIQEYLGNQSILLDNETKEAIINGFMSKEDFIGFHGMQDDNTYLEIKEEIKELKEKKARKVLEDYFEKNGITDSKQLINRDDLIINLLKETQLSYRKIAEITETSLNTVYRVSKKLST